MCWNITLNPFEMYKYYKLIKLNLTSITFLQQHLYTIKWLDNGKYVLLYFLLHCKHCYSLRQQRRKRFFKNFLFKYSSSLLVLHQYSYDIRITQFIPFLISFFKKHKNCTQCWNSSSKPTVSSYGWFRCCKSRERQ